MAVALLDVEGPLPLVQTHEAADEVVGRVGKDLGRRTDLGDLATLLEDHDLVAEQERLVDVVRDEDDGLVEILLQPQQLLPQLVAHDGVDRAERLVHQQHVGISHEPTGHADALLLATGELRPVLARQGRVQTDRLEHGACSVAGLLLGDSLESQHRSDVVDDGAVRQQACLLHDVADAASQLDRVACGDVDVVDQHLPMGGFDHPVDHAQQGGLATPGRPDEDSRGS